MAQIHTLRSDTGTVSAWISNRKNQRKN
jgi:hypothetical protein